MQILQWAEFPVVSESAVIPPWKRFINLSSVGVEFLFVVSITFRVVGHVQNPPNLEDWYLDCSLSGNL